MNWQKVIKKIVRHGFGTILLGSVILWIVSHYAIIGFSFPTRSNKYFNIQSCYGIVNIGEHLDFTEFLPRRLNFYCRNPSKYEDMIEDLRLIGIPMQRLSECPSFEWESYRVESRGILLGSDTLSFPYWCFVIPLSMLYVFAFHRQWIWRVFVKRQKLVAETHK